MDRNSVIGLLVIAGILIVFSIYNSPSEEEIREAKAKKEQQDSLKNTEKEKIEAELKKDSLQTELASDSTKESSEVASNSAPSPLVPKTDANGNILYDSLGHMVMTDTVTGKDTSIVTKKQNAAPGDLGEFDIFSKARNKFINNKADSSLLTIENEQLIVKLTPLGGRIASVYLKKFETYKEYKNKEEFVPLQLFDMDSTTYGLSIKPGERRFNTSELYFEAEQKSDRSIQMTCEADNGGTISFTYTLEESDYDVDFQIDMNELPDLDEEKISLESKFKLLQTERLLSEQKRVSTIFFKYHDDGYDYLWETSDDELEMENKSDWIAFKQSFFSAIFMPETKFGKNSFIEIVDENSKKYIKTYYANMELDIKDASNAQTSINWYFGPNDYDLLAQYGNESEDIINLGWGLFRWVNIYMIQPIFNFLTNLGVSIGIAILLLTIIVKLILSPITFKMYMSSAKMRVLKPEIQELNEKYPDKADAMKKQSEMMKLYSETGVNPLSGCVPMLIQMPILFAVFRFFPASIDLRQKSFLWADDLSAYDSILNLGFNIPLYGDHVSLFTLLMAASTLFYTVFNSSNMTQPSQPGMPNMKVIMYIFPIMMIFFFNNFAAGLSYYYFISNLMSIGIMVGIKRFMVDEEKIRAKIESKKANPKKKKSKFQERLEQMQQQQKEKMKNKKK